MGGPFAEGKESAKGEKVTYGENIFCFADCECGLGKHQFFFKQILAPSTVLVYGFLSGEVL
ncbi:hypothetical protein, partial [Mailhella massiliensis]